jgi:uncharacterized protein YabE (DUF348 family)
MGLSIVVENTFKEYKHLIITAAIMVILLGLFMYIVALDSITVTVDGRDYQWKTLAGTVESALRERNIVLNPGDEVKPGPEARVYEGMAIQIIRGFSVVIKRAGTAMNFATTAKPVGEVLLAAGIKTGADDRIVPSPDYIVKPNQIIRVIGVTTNTITRQVVLNPATELVKDGNMDRGDQKIIRQGEPGLAERKVKEIYEDGRLSRTVTLAEKILKPVKNTVIALGIKPVVRVLETSRATYRYVEMRVMEATAYYPGPESCGIYARNGRTYTGKKAGFGTVAVDKRIIPLGTKLYIEGYGYAEATDIGAAIKGNRIDLCFETYREAEMFGRRKVKVYILE